MAHEKFAHRGAIVRNISKWIPLAALLAAAAPACGGETAGQLMVSVNIVASCRLSVDTAALSFGDVQQGTEGADAHAELGVSCSRDLPYAIAFDYGQHAQGAQRRMSNGNAEVEYGLYADAAHQHPIGPRGSGSELRGTGNGDQQRLPVYARLDVGRDAPAGAYTDVVRMTVVW